MTTDTIEVLRQDINTLRIYLKRLKLHKDNGGYAGLCPFHQEKSASFKINRHEGSWLWRCWGCDKKGDVLDFVQLLDKCSMSAAIQKIKSELNLTEKDLTLKGTVDETFVPVAAAKKTYSLEEYKPMEDALAESPARAFLEKRGITYETAKRLHFGFRQTVNGISHPCPSGWIAMPRILAGQITGIKYRAIDSKTFTQQSGMATGLFNLETVDALAPVYILEGEMDVAIMEQAGYRAVGLPSAVYKPTPQELDELRQAEYIILAGDTDSAGAEAMSRLWTELGDRTYLLKWPSVKDANELYLKDPKSFRDKVLELSAAAKSTPMPNIVSLAERMASGSRVTLTDHPHRWHCPFPSIDNMIRLLPGSILGISGVNTGVGKSTFAMNCEIYEAMKYNEVVINYSAELSVEEHIVITAAHLLKKDRTKLCETDYKLAARKLGNAQYYIGFHPDYSTIWPALDLIEAGIKRLGATRVILDHIHIMTLNESNPIEAQAAAMQRIKGIAQKTETIWLVLGQPRKANQQTRGKAIHLTDIKGSEGLVSTSDAYLSIHRETAKFNDPNNPPRDPYEAATQIQLLKGRSLGGGAAFANLVCMGELATFYEESHRPEENSGSLLL